MSKVINLNVVNKGIDPADSFILEARKLYSVGAFGAEMNNNLIYQVGYNFLYGIVAEFWVDGLSHLVPEREDFLKMDEQQCLSLASDIIGVRFGHWFDFIVYHSELISNEASMIQLTNENKA